ncbi:MAG TPA: hypothetical protein VK154_13675 [Chitinophagales bacterium]|nr:hypothetical protein [Chitinophagales bacterium]
MLTLFKDIYYSFPVQLLLLSFKRHQFLLFFWLLMFAIIVGKFGAGIGTHSVLLDPEYLGNVGYLSFAVVGIGFGAMFITWNVVMYILNSHRFPFMASLQYPLGMFVLNNALIPGIFIITYIVSVIIFRVQYEFETPWQIVFEILGFTAGFILVILITAVYFNFTNKNTGSIIQENKERVRRKRAVRRVQFSDTLQREELNKVEFYLTNKFNIRHTRTVDHYDPKLHQLVFRRHHWNAFMAFLVTMTLLVSMGFFLENPFFQFPIAATGFLFVSLLMSLFGMFLYWTGGWGSAAIIVFLLVANYLTQYDVFGFQSRAYGLNYSTRARYNLETFRELSSDSLIAQDKEYFKPILENWLHKNTDPRNPFKKPKMYFVNVSGGGLRAAMYSMVTLQFCDSLAKGNLLDKTFLISGASGGMFATTYLRELFLQKKNGFPINLSDPQYTENVSKDVLNPIALSIISNDVLIPFHKFKLNDKKYSVDRGYVFEKFYCRNLQFPFEKTIGDYRQDEYSAKIPLLIFHTTIMNDSRRYYISPQPVSFLMRPHGKKALDNRLEIDAIDFGRFFKKQASDSLLVTSAMRMNATFPFFFPNSVLPSEPSTYVMDGGALDNFGIETTLRFLNTFGDWIDKNTSGVVIIQIRDSEKFEEPAASEKKTVFARITDPLGTVYTNMENMQDFLTDYRLDEMSEELRGKLQFVLFEYTSEKVENKAAMSLHLTTRDKSDIMRSMKRPNNVKSFNKLQELFAE